MGWKQGFESRSVPGRVMTAYIPFQGETGTLEMQFCFVELSGVHHRYWWVPAFSVVSSGIYRQWEKSEKQMAKKREAEDRREDRRFFLSETNSFQICFLFLALVDLFLVNRAWSIILSSCRFKLCFSMAASPSGTKKVDFGEYNQLKKACFGKISIIPRIEWLGRNLEY